MIVGLDSTPLTVATGGIRRYVEQLHAALTEEYPRDQFLLLSGAGGYGAGAPLVAVGPAAGLATERG